MIKDSYFTDEAAAKDEQFIVRTEFLTKDYGEATAVRTLDGVSLSVADNEFVAIAGPPGSGKSTLLNLIGTLDRPTSGLVVIDGVNIDTLKGDNLTDFRREKIGFVFQFSNLLPSLNAIENVMLPLIPYQHGLIFNAQRRARELLKTVGLGDKPYHLPEQLSGLEQQRIAIARALINAPKIILVDEPIGSSDPKSGEEIMRLLRQLYWEEKLTIILVTHDAKIAAQADRILRLKDGQLLEH